MMDAVLQQRAGDLLLNAGMVNRYETQLDQAHGDRFNVFRVLGISRYETITHSPMIGELLNPAGRHGKGHVFLDAFLQIVGIKNFMPEGALLDLEFHAGPKTEKSGGRLDILIREAGSDRRIVIENKVDAGLQERQLERYDHFACGHEVLFLTLDGGLPEGIDFSEFKGLRDISYRSHIRLWLERCRELAADAPRLRESVVQYLDLIDELTGNNLNPSMSSTLADMILNSRENYDAFISLKRSQSEVELRILEKLEAELKTACDKLALEIRFDTASLGNTGGSITFLNEELIGAGLGMGMEFGKSGYRDCDWGFFFLPKVTESSTTESLREFFRQEFGSFKSATYWPAYRNWSEYRTWTEEVFAEIQFGTFSTKMIREVERLLKIFRQVVQMPEA